MKKANKEIKNQFDFFNELVYTDKIISDNEVIMHPKKSNAFWLNGQSNVQHSTISEDIIFMIEQSKRDNKYGIKLRCTNFINEPFFRFDSDGPAHRNEDPNIPLDEQLIKTPHFNSFDESGNYIAYHNDTLKKENEAIIIANDINFGISLFCMETNSKLKDNNFPTLVQLIPEIEFPENNNINFDNINFE
ncbi:hypothetical protein [Flavobacterium sp.]|uniref:hypothetical protein n=1 Tax=Flavobacterium sp. TaxID=239 RepID=UPI000ECBF20D|nr:hypothetical protein [Flavobacterium sp.]HCQ13760.1 hypothetical protein [Flavobacterium sp.]